MMESDAEKIRRLETLVIDLAFALAAIRDEKYSESPNSPAYYMADMALTNHMWSFRSIRHLLTASTVLNHQSHNRYIDEAEFEELRADPASWRTRLELQYGAAR